MSEFYKALDAKEQEERIRRISVRPANLHDYQGCEADHARIVAEKYAEIQRLREALADAEHLCKWLLQSDITEADKWSAVRDLGINLALALNPPQQVSSACGHQRHDECHFAACVCECHNPPQQKDGE